MHSQNSVKDPPKTITFFAAGSPEDPSGIKYVPLGREFIRRGYKVNCITTHPDLKSLPQRQINLEGMEIYFAGQMQVLKRNNRKFYFNPVQLTWVLFKSVWGMIVRGLSLKTDAIYCFKPQPMAGFAALVVKLIKRKPLIIDTDDYEAGFNRLSGFQKIIVGFFEDHLPRFAQKVTYNTSFLKERYLHLGYPENKFIKLQYSPDASFFNNRSQTIIDQIRMKYHLHDKKVVLYFGSLSLDSGHAVDLLIEAFTEVCKVVPDAVLLIVGGGEDFDYLQTLVGAEFKNRIHFVGRVAPEEIPHFLHCAQVSVDPARNTENNKGRSPWKIFESMVSGVPVVTADIGDRREYLANGAAGVLVKPDDAKELAQGIIKILSDEQLAQKMSSQCRQIMSNHTWPKLVDHLILEIPAFRP